MNRVMDGSTDLFRLALDRSTMDGPIAIGGHQLSRSRRRRHQIRALAVVGPAQRRRTRAAGSRAPAPRARVQTRLNGPGAGVRMVRLHRRRGRKGPDTACAGDRNGYTPSVMSRLNYVFFPGRREYTPLLMLARTSVDMSTFGWLTRIIIDSFI